MKHFREDCSAVYINFGGGCLNCGAIPERDDGMNCFPKHVSCLHRDYIGKAVTLHGMEAKIVLDGEGYPEVAPLDPAHGKVPFSWTGVYSVVDNKEGKFGY